MHKTLPNTYNLLLNYSFIEIYFTYHRIHLLKVYNSMVFSIFKSCTTITRSILEHFHHLEKKPYTITSHSPISPPLSSWQPLIYFLSLWIGLLWTLHINNHKICGLLWLASSLSRLFSRFIHGVACVRISFLFTVECCSIVWMDFHCMDVPLYGYTTLVHGVAKVRHNLVTKPYHPHYLIHSSIGGHWDCFHLLTIINNAAMISVNKSCCCFRHSAWHAGS